jgi:threonine/homoserine/homoserine lactone efflux protein
LENTRASALALLGFVTAVSNPKGWAFLLALLPAFVAANTPLLPQFAIMLAIMLTTEFFSMTAYATGGQWLAMRLSNTQGLLNANRVAASMLGLAALWVLSGALG